MRLTLRAKLLALVAVAAGALIAIIVASTILSDRIAFELERIRETYLPLVELRPRVEAGFERLTRSFQDIVAAHEVEALGGTRAQVDGILGDLAAASRSLDPAKTAAARIALDSYHRSAVDVARRLMQGETGEDLVAAMATMQERHKSASAALMEAVALDREAISTAFSAASESQSTASRARLILALVSLVGVVVISLALARGVLRSLTQIDAGLGRFGRGDFAQPIQLEGRDELAKIARRANEMAQSLERLERDRRRTDWLETGHAELALTLRGELSPRDVATNALAFFARYLEAPIAAFYKLDEHGSLEPLALHAPPAGGTEAPAEQAPAFRLGEGMVGQAAMHRELVVVPGPPADYYLRVRSALGERSPTTLVLVPLVRGERVIGVIELGLFKACGELERQLLLTTRESLAIALEAARSNADTRTLLAETQELARRLAAQDEELRAMNEELQTQQEELRQTNDELAAVSTYKSQFLTSMSHELRTPLNSMLLLSSLLAENEAGNLSAKQVEFCRTIHSAGKELLALISHVLDLARVEAGKQQLEIGPVDLGEVAERARRVFEPQANDKGLTFVTHVDPSLPDEIRSDEQRIHQILNNLIGNAVKFSSAGTIALKIQRPEPHVRFRRAGLRHQDTVALVVTDEGPGIAPAEQERIFTPFEQLGGETDKRYGGTGLGLALARELANLLGGEIQLDSEPGRGSTFTCYLPEGREPLAQADLPGAEVAPPAASPLTLADDRARLAPGEPHLLVIEDDPGFTMVVGEVIHAHGLKFVAAGSAAGALELARARRPSGIILDVKLPDADGFSVMRALRDDPTTAEIPVHFVSAVDAVARGMALGAIGYLVKPVTRRDLVQVIESLVPAAAARARQILVVEDDAVTGESILKMLVQEDLVARRVTSARDALAALSEERFGCVILDLALPDMDGLELLETLQREGGEQMPSVVVYTGRPLSVEETKRLEAYTEAIVLKEGQSADRVLNEVRLFVRRLREGLLPRRPSALGLPPGDLGLGGRQALVVDDDMRTVYALSAALRAKGMEVFVADNGRGALEALDVHPGIAIVLMDIMMPVMDGYQAMQRIRQDERFGELPIIALTAKAMKDEAAKCLRAGASAYLPKPIDAARLLALIDRHVNGQHVNGRHVNARAGDAAR